MILQIGVVKLKNIKTLLLKDFYEYKNNYWKIMYVLIIAIIFPNFMFSVMGNKEMILADQFVMVEVIILVFVSILYVETTLFQVHRDVKFGIYERFFINTYLKKSQIVISKFISNLIMTFIALILLFIVNQILLTLIDIKTISMFNILFISKVCFACAIGTTIGFAFSLLIHDEKNASLYGIVCFSIYFLVYKIFEIMGMNSESIELIVLFIISVALLGCVAILFKKNKFICRN